MGWGVAGWIDSVVDLDDAAFGAADDAFLFLLHAAGQHHVGMMRCFRKKEIDNAEELQFLQSLAREIRVGQRDQRIEADGEQRLDFAAMDSLHDLDGGIALLSDFVFLNTPDLRDMPAPFRIVDLALTGKLIALLAMFAAALSIALAGDHHAARAFAADVAPAQIHVDHRPYGFDAFGVMLDSAAMHPHSAVVAGDPARRPFDEVRRTASHFRNP